MNFFSYQDQARRNTVWLVVLFVVGVIGTIAALYVAVSMILIFTGAWEPVDEAGLWSPELLLGITLLVGGVLAFGSGSKYLMLRKGGGAVACSLGGHPIAYESDDPAERRLMNVVEEMAIASGTPVPPVYVLEEQGINAFAAGHSMNDAVIGVTRGALNVLNRDELQGVIAHEFSHIVNQDVRLNLRLMVIIAGLIMLSVLGRQVLYGFGRAGMMRGRRRMGGGRGGGSGQGQIVVLLIGVSFLVIGAIGVWCSRLIKAAISRQREFLADASAVQFTRNPQGLAGALKKIQQGGARVEHPNAEDASHLFFGDALARRAFSTSTHPPLSKRIERLDPSYAGAREDLPTVGPTGESPVSMLSGSQPDAPAPRLEMDAATVRHQVGTLSPERLAYGHDVLERLPANLRRAAHESLGAVGIAFALVLDEAPAHRKRQRQIARDRAEEAALEELEHVEEAVRNLDPWLRLPLAELLIPALRQLDRAQYANFASTLRALMLHDEEVTIFQFTLMKMILHQLDASYKRSRKRRQKYKSVAVLKKEVWIVLTALAKAGSNDPDEQLAALNAGLGRLDEGWSASALEEESYEHLSASLDRMAAASPSIKEQLIDACSHVVLANKAVNLNEAELLRAVAVTLDCPLPPFVPRVRVA